MGRWSFAERVVQWGVGHSLARRELLRRADDNVLAFLGAVLPRVEGLTELRDPEAFVEFLRGCVDRQRHQVVESKRAPEAASQPSLRFSTLLDTLREGTLPVPFAVATTLAHIADGYRKISVPFGNARWAADAGMLFEISSSLARKGRVLWNIVRVARCSRALELGTAYGMSGLFMLESMRDTQGGGHLTTVEIAEPQFSLAAKTLQGRFGDAVTCVKGSTDEVLPEVAKRAAPIDLLFHDASHSRVAYERDFAAVVDHLAPGALVIFDDIRWEDPRFHTGPADTHAGWSSVVAHSRIVRAAEIDASIGLALVA